MPEAAARRPVSVFLTLAHAIGQTQTVEEIYAIALDALADGLAVDRSSVLLFDPDGVMRFKASRGLSSAYRAAVEGHSPWTPGAKNAEPIVVPDVEQADHLQPYLATIRAEHIGAMAFVPLLSRGEVIGKFMLYFAEPRSVSNDELQLVCAIAAQVAFAVERTRAEALARRSEERLHFALDAASMGTWDWNLLSNRVVWSDNLEQIHGLPPGTFDGTFSSYEREVHPDDRERVLASTQRAIAEGVEHEVEYRIIAPDGTVRWCEGKGRVDFEDGRPVRMSGVCMIVTRRKEAELARLAAAEEASRLKDEFLATLSHELRTPLNAMLGWVQMLQQEQLGPERTKQAIEVIGRNARLQAQLIEDILDVSRIITGKLPLDRAPLSVDQLIDFAVAAIAPSAQAKHIAITRRLEEDLPPIEGDAKRLQQVLGNVLANAVKFTPDHGAIAVSCAAVDGTVRIEVADTGVGIEPAFLPYVFDRFRQADSRTTRRHGGLGLGLAIAHYLVEQHGGQIAALSDGAGSGTTVVITLPCPAVARVDATPPHDAPVPAAFRLDDRIVLVADDEPDSCDMLASLLERRGASVVRCGNAAEALAAFATTRVDLLIADIAMPDVDGYELVAQARQAGHRVPAVAVTAFARRDDEVRTLAAGFDAYLTKPIDTAHLLAAVARLLSPREPAATRPVLPAR